MDLTVNGQTVKLADNTTLAGFLGQKGLNLSTIVVEYNADIPDRSTWKDLVLSDGDKLEIVKFMGGGAGGRH